MNIVGLLQESLAKTRSNPMILIPILGASVIIALLSLILIGTLVPQIGHTESEIVVSAEEALGFAGMAIGRVIALMIVGSIVGLLAHGMTVLMANDALNGRDVRLNTAWEQTQERIVPLVVTSVVVGLIVSIGMALLIIPGIVLAFFLMFGIVALMLDGLAPIKAISKSFTTVKSNIASTFVFFLVMLALGFLTFVVNFVIGMIPILGAILSVVVFSVYASFLTVFVVVVYRGITADDTAPPQPEV